ncbi:unnamed protein product [Gordionus sp. m RMFG-2023]
MQDIIEPYAMWLKGGNKVDLDSGRYTQLDNMSLVIDPVLAQDEGVYKCLVNNPYGESGSGEVVVQLQESIGAKIDSHSKEYHKGESIKLTCGGSGNYEKMEWFKDDTQIPENDPRIKILGNGTLIITGANKWDGGEYECRAKNKLTTASDKTKVVILERGEVVPDSEEAESKGDEFGGGEAEVGGEEHKDEVEPKDDGEPKDAGEPKEGGTEEVGEGAGETLGETGEGGVTGIPPPIKPESEAAGGEEVEKGDEELPPAAGACVDNSALMQCQLVVQAKLCHNPYFAQFCCESCTKAGQSPNMAPNIATMGNMAPGTEYYRLTKRRFRERSQ